MVDYVSHSIYALDAQDGTSIGHAQMAIPTSELSFVDVRQGQLTGGDEVRGVLTERAGSDSGRL
jgi:hypothetical protein